MLPDSETFCILLLGLFGHLCQDLMASSTQQVRDRSRATDSSQDTGGYQFAGMDPQ